MTALSETLAEWRDTIGDYLPESGWLKGIPVVLALYLLAALVLGIYWSRAPDIFDVRASAEEKALAQGHNTVPGYVTTATIIRVASTLLDKPGGYLSNDVMPPGLYLDNMPNWEKGVVTQMRDLSRAIRNDFSRSQSQSKEDPDVVEAVEKFFSESNSWIFPPTEQRYREGIAALYRYQDRLTGTGAREAHFYARADNLREWLAEGEKRLGSMSRRLGNSVAASASGSLRCASGKRTASGNRR